MIEWITELGIQARNAIPVPLALVGDAAGFFTLDTSLKLLGGLYVALQAAFLIWKWRIAHKEYVNANT